MCDRCAFPDVADGHRRRGSGDAVGHPDAGHRDGRVLLGRHAVALEGTGVLVGFDIGALHPEGGDDIVHALVVLFEELGEGVPPVAQELLALFRAAYDLSGQHGQPGHELIAPAGLELAGHGGCPGLRSRLVTIYQQVRYSLLSQHSAGGLPVHLQIAPEITFPGSGIEFVHLEPRRVRRCRVVHLAGQRCPEAPDAPSALRQGTVQVPVFRHICAEVQHVFFLDAECFRNLRSGIFPRIHGD